MGRFHHITVFLITEEEKVLFSEAGVEFTAVTRGPRGESVDFDIGEDDRRWDRVVALIASLEEREGLPKEHRVQNLSMTASTMEENRRQTEQRVNAYMKSRPGPKWLKEYSGESAEQLLSLEGVYPTDLLVVAFEQGINQKAKREGPQSLSVEERTVLAVAALEREVNNGGYDQFFINSSREFAPIVVGALQRIGCEKTANITQRAIETLGISDLTSDAIEAVICTGDEKRVAKLNSCTDSYHTSTEPVAERLFAFIKAKRASLSL